MNIRLIKRLDEIVGCILITVLPRPQYQVYCIHTISYLIIRPGGIGDAVLLAPTIRALKTKYPQAHITILAEQRNAGVFPLIPGIDTILCYDRPREFIQALRGRYDVVIDTEQWHRLSAVASRLISAPVKIGFDSNERRRMFTHPVPYSHDIYEAESFANLLQPLGIGNEVVCRTARFLTIPGAAAEKAALLLEPLDGKPFVAIFPGASIPERRWGVERFGVVAATLADKGFKIVVVGGCEDRADGKIIVGAMGLTLAGITTLAETAAVIARSSLLISGDSGVLHIAVGLDISTVSLFGPGLAEKWAPKGDKHVILNRCLVCSPCTRFGTTPPCSNDVRCMKEITAAQVVEAAVTLLNRNAKS